ncbi:RNA-directed DNA polymerase [Acinetobacter sp.]|uniref:RNA-directed DNA polymerase n=1 Tax=Acinetobacter sp. TaxID=472 RepID=UPI003D062788
MTLKKNNKILCYSLPDIIDNFLIKEKDSQITNWWLNIEQQSLQLAMEFSYIIHTDITNCYGSMYTHSVAWALHDKDFCKKKENKHNKHLLGNILDKLLRNMSYGQTNGLPQGSNLIDFIAEIVLGYSDQELSKKINDTNITDYKILRYRDDYRIFTNSEQEAKIITKLLSETLFELGMSLNSQKTFSSTDIIKSSLKEDKWYWITNKQGNRFIQNHLIVIYELSLKFPNSGSLKKALMKFHERLSGKDIRLADFKVLISITTAIMLKNPSVYMICTAILSVLFEFLETPEEVDKTLELIRKKLSTIPNIGHLQIWLQRMTLKYNSNIEYSEKLTKKALDSNIILWNSTWISAEKLRSIVNSTSIVLENEIESVEKIITHHEMKFYFTGFSYTADVDEFEYYEPSY